MKIQSHSRALACVALALALGACSQSAPRKATVAAKPAAPKPAVVVPQPDPDAVVQSGMAEPSPVFDEQYHGPDQGSLESVTALFARGYIESAMRETMLAVELPPMINGATASFQTSMMLVDDPDAPDAGAR